MLQRIKNFIDSKVQIVDGKVNFIHAVDSIHGRYWWTQCWSVRDKITLPRKGSFDVNGIQVNWKRRKTVKVDCRNVHYYIWVDKKTLV